LKELEAHIAFRLKTKDVVNDTKKKKEEEKRTGAAYCFCMYDDLVIFPWFFGKLSG
jgi:hypothetical protein